MMILLSPQVRIADEEITYLIKGESIKVTINDKYDFFDFSEFPDGKLESVESDVLDFCPIISGERKDGVLYIELLNYIEQDATEEEKFPMWQEVLSG